MELVPMIDLRHDDEFSIAHWKGSSSFPWHEIESRLHELPPKGTAVRFVIGDSPSVEEASQFFQDHGYQVHSVIQANGAEWEEQKEKLESGNTSVRLWKCNPFLEEVIPELEAIFSGKRTERTAMVLTSQMKPHIKDLACGSARDAIFLALRGWKVTAVDYLQNLLDKAKQLAGRHHCELNTICIDMEDNTPDFLLKNLPKVDLIHVARYLHRPLFPTIVQLVNPGGFVVYHTFMKGVEKFGKPRRERFILQPNELKELLPGFKVMKYLEGTIEDGRPIQFIVAQKPFDFIFLETK